MKRVERKILKEVHEISLKYPEGENFFNELDDVIANRLGPEVILPLFKRVPKNHFVVLSGGFGKRVARGIDIGEFPQVPYYLFQGGIRSGKSPMFIQGRVFGGEPKNGIFLDDSIYGGATYKALQKYFQKGKLKLEKCLVIYDGCPVKKSDVGSLFRYYDHFEVIPNFEF